MSNMDDYALQQELEALAGNAYNPDVEDRSEPMSTTVARWQKLFGLSGDEALDCIMSHRDNLMRTRVSDAHWETLREHEETEGRDRESYEYELDLQKRKAALPFIVPAANEHKSQSLSYLVELNGPLDDVFKVQQVAGMDKPPAVVNGRSLEDGRAVTLCCIDEVAKQRFYTGQLARARDSSLPFWSIQNRCSQRSIWFRSDFLWYLLWIRQHVLCLSGAGLQGLRQAALVCSFPESAFAGQLR